MRLPQFGSAFRLTHRFSLPLNNTSSDEIFGQLFGIDSSAVVGLEYRFGLMQNLQAGIHHSGLGRTWSFFGQYGIARQDRGLPVDLTALASFDIPRVPVVGTPGAFERRVTPAFAIMVSRMFTEQVAMYVEPTIVTNIYNSFLTPSTSEHALLIGIGGRVLVTPTVSLVAEVVPRVAGLTANTHHAAFGIEKRAGGHLFQVNFSNSFASTMSQLAPGGEPANNWHLGFNLSRKFY